MLISLVSGYAYLKSVNQASNEQFDRQITRLPLFIALLQLFELHVLHF